jgi:hypothetical protein
MMKCRKTSCLGDSRDLREKRDSPEVIFSRVAPVTLVALSSRSLRTTFLSVRESLG